MSIEDTGIIDLGRLKGRDFSKIFLRRNPFPSITVPEDAPVITADREAIINHFKETIAEIYQDNQTKITAIVGDYGSGKSHLLKVFKRSINSQLLKMEEKTLGVYIRSPGSNFKEFLFYFIEDIGMPLLSHFSKEFIKRFLEEDRSRVSKYLYDLDLKRKQPSAKLELDVFLQKSTYIDFFTDVRDKFFKEIQNSDLLYAFLFLAHPEFSSVAWRWFLGESLDKDERELLQLERKGILESETAYKVFNGLLMLLKKVNIQTVFLLVDEMEKITLIPGLAKATYQDDLRHLIDDNPRGLGIFFAIAFERWNDLTQRPTALVRRLQGNVFKLEDFDFPQVKELIAKYLRFGRIIEKYDETQVKTAHAGTSPELYPFTEPAIAKIQELTKGRISSVLLTSRKCLDYLVDNIDKHKLIDEELVSEVSKIEGF